MNAEKSIDAPKNVGRDGTGKRNDERQQGINEPPTALSAKAGGREVVLKGSKDIAEDNHIKLLLFGWIARSYACILQGI
jgi:hypothetical protein